MRNPIAIVLAFIASCAVAGLCSAQPSPALMPPAADGTTAPELGQSPQWSAPSDRVLQAVRATPTLVLDRDFAFPSLQASRAQTAATQSQSASSNNNALKWVGVGMMVLGGAWTLSALQCGAVAVGSDVDGIGGVCTSTLVLGGGLAGAGWFVFDRNR